MLTQSNINPAVMHTRSTSPRQSPQCVAASHHLRLCGSAKHTISWCPMSLARVPALQLWKNPWMPVPRARSASFKNMWRQTRGVRARWARQAPPVFLGSTVDQPPSGRDKEGGTCAGELCQRAIVVLLCCTGFPTLEPAHQEGPVRAQVWASAGGSCRIHRAPRRFTPARESPRRQRRWRLHLQLF
jgi:hypothetical protein